MLFHADAKTFPGGFVGVDVFFVISGFIITTKITNEHREGTFRFLNFYERRARRLLPSLFIVLLLCIPFAWFCMSPSDLRDFSKELIAVTTLCANLFIWNTSGYFDQNVDLNPLVHTWSLALEEQFYLLFPLLLMLNVKVNRLLPAMPNVILAGALCLSLAAAQLGAYRYPDAAFFLLPSRIWEFVIGAFVAQAKSKRNRPVQGDFFCSELLSVIGFGMMLLSFIFFDSGTPHPGLCTLLPVSGTALSILYSNDRRFVGRLLTNGVLAGIGSISYSAYLWHQPILAFAKQLCLLDLNRQTPFALVTLSFAPAYLSWRYVETPFRNRDITSFRVFGVFVGFAAILIVGSSLCGIFLSGVEYRSDETNFALVPKEAYEQYVWKRKNNLELKEFSKSRGTKVLIIGDSYSGDVINAIYESTSGAPMQLSSYTIGAACGNLYLNYSIASYISPKKRGGCEKSGWYENENLLRLMGDADSIWLVSSWNHWTVRFLKESVSNLEKRFGSKFIVFSSKNFGRVNIAMLRKKNIAERVFLRAPMRSDVSNVNRLLQASFNDTRYVDVSSFFCDIRGCSQFTSAGDLISFDGSHLTRQGAKWLGMWLRRHRLLAKFFDSQNPPTLSSVRAPGPSGRRLEMGIK